MNFDNPLVLLALVVGGIFVFRAWQANRASRQPQPVRMQAAEFRAAEPTISPLDQAVLDMHDAEDRARRLAAVPHTVASLGKHEAARRATGQVEAYKPAVEAPKS